MDRRNKLIFWGERGIFFRGEKKSQGKIFSGNLGKRVRSVSGRDFLNRQKRRKLRRAWLFFVVLLRVKISTVDNGFRGAASAENFWQGDGGGGGFQKLEEGFFEFFDEKGKGAADDEEARRFFLNDVEKTEREAGDKVGSYFGSKRKVGKRGAIGVRESFGGGNIFPLEEVVVIFIADMARFKSGGFGEEGAVVGDSAADSG